MMALSLHFGHKQQGIAQDKAERHLEALKKQFHKKADESIKDVRQLNKVLSEGVIANIHGATHVR